jgi:hypothetical protein
MQSKEEIERFLDNTACCPGHRYTLVLASLTKRMLTQEMPPEYRVQFLEHLDKMQQGQIGQWLTTEMIAALEPMCDKADEIASEMRKLGTKALDAYAKFFSTFAALNPSLVAVLKMSPAYQNERARADYRVGVDA